MKAKIKIEKEVEITKVHIQIQPRYIGDSHDDDMPSDFPGLCSNKQTWAAVVDIDTGIIASWPQGIARKMHVKVCDAGLYTLFDADGNSVARIDGYVPHGVVPGSYGDYVELTIDENGKITNWPAKPDISEFFSDEC